MRDYKKLINYAKESDHEVCIVVTRDELIQIRNEYDKKYTLKQNKLQLADLVHDRAILNGVRLKLGIWDHE
jgi:hypothetical protein